MPKTIQIRDLADQTYAVLSQRAARENISVPELIRRELTRLASAPSALEWLERTDRPVIHSGVDSVAAIQEAREEWTNARS